MTTDRIVSIPTVRRVETQHKVGYGYVGKIKFDLLLFPNGEVRWEPSTYVDETETEVPSW